MFSSLPSFVILTLSTVLTALLYPVLATATPNTTASGSTILSGYDYIVVGSGPGGAPLASRLGLAGYSVLVIEAGEDVTAMGDWNVTVPMFNAKAAEDEKLAWNFYVNHYPHMSQDQTDPKFAYALPNGTLYTGIDPPLNAKPKGLLYPRTAAIGGCVNHNALIMMYPLEADFNELVSITGDSAFNAQNMRKYFQKVEQCQYMPRGAAGHGFDGWLPTNRADESIFLVDEQVSKMLGAALTISDQTVGSKGNLTTSLLRDMNAVQDFETHQGLFNTPLNMNQHKRSSPRDFLVTTASYLASKPGRGRIDIRTNCLVTRIIFNPKTTYAIGVEFQDGQSLYRADLRSPGIPDGPLGTALASKEVIISAGAFNTPQLLKLSGIGPSAELKALNIPILVDLPGVGQNLQDRYENSVIVNLPKSFVIWKNCTNGATAADPCLTEWNTMQSNKSRYATNGRPVSIPKRSTGALAAANDLIVTGRPGYFGGYFEGYSKIGGKYPNSWTWPVLKARTQNRAGNVTLLSSNPRDTPSVNFNYFSSGSGNWSYDLAATVEGMQFTRSIIDQYRQTYNETVVELIPGPGYESKTKLTEWVAGTSWGHHACCTSKIGADGDKMAVLDGKFRVRGTKGLRVVDASVFPDIPGYYIQTPIYMMSEKAADDIIKGR